MKKLMIIAVMAGMAVSAQAQEKAGKTSAERAQQRTERMTKELALTPEQKAKVEAINLRYAEKGAEVRQAREAERAQARKEGKAMHDAHDAEMKTVLTAEQYTKWVAHKEEMKQKRMAQRKEMRGLKKTE